MGQVRGVSKEYEGTCHPSEESGEDSSGGEEWEH
jgi:hypothetical protein